MSLSERSDNSFKTGKDFKTVKERLYVKYMVCLKDKLLLQSVLDAQNVNYRFSVHEAIEILEEMTYFQQEEVKFALLNSGMIVLDKEISKVIDRIINTIIEVIHYTDSLPKLRFADIISEYSRSEKEDILKIFSDVKGMSVLQFIIVQKIERAKELILYDELSFPEIADRLNYKNQDYLTAQFKKITGLTPAYFKDLKKMRMTIAQQHLSNSQSDSSRQ